MPILIDRERRQAEAQTPKELAGKARELWNVLAPDRDPLLLTTAVLDFRFVASGTSAETPMEKAFLDYLRDFRSRHDEFTAFLKVNPSPEKRFPYSFILGVIAAPEYQIIDTEYQEVENVLLFEEYPRESGLIKGLFLPYRMEVLKGDGRGINPGVPNTKENREFTAGVLDLLTRMASKVDLEVRKNIDTKFQEWMQENGDPFG